MSLGNLLLLGILLFSLAVFVVLLFSTIFYLIGHGRRKHIQFDNFEQKIKYFNVETPQVPLMLFSVFSGIISITIFFVLIGGFQEYYGYILSQVILLILSFGLYQIFHIIKYFNKDLSVYEANFKTANNALKTKGKVLASISKTKNYRKEVLQLIHTFENQISEVEDPSKFQLKDSISIINDFVETQTLEIETFTDEILKNFNKGITSYFKHNIPVPIVLPSITLNFEKQYEDIRNGVYEGYKQIFNNTIYTLIETKKYKTAKHITDGLQILKNNNYKPSQRLIELILASVDSIQGHPQDLVDYLLKNEIIELEELITYAISSNMSWVFKLDLFKTQEQLMTISKRLIEENAYSLALSFITKYFSNLNQVLSFVFTLEEVNETSVLFRQYIKVKLFDSSFYTEHKEYENKLIALLDFYQNKKAGQKLANDLKEVSSIPSAYKNKETINKLYNYTQNKSNNLITMSIKALLLYSTESKKDDLFDIEKLSATLNDYQERLLIEDLGLLTILLYSLFIHTNKGLEMYDEIISDIRNTPELLHYVTESMLNIESSKHKIISKEIQNRLATKHTKQLSNIVLKIEKERCTLDQLKI